MGPSLFSPALSGMVQAFRLTACCSSRMDFALRLTPKQRQAVGRWVEISSRILLSAIANFVGRISLVIQGYLPVCISVSRAACEGLRVSPAKGSKAVARIILWFSEGRV